MHGSKKANVQQPMPPTVITRPSTSVSMLAMTDFTRAGLTLAKTYVSKARL